MPKEPYSVDTLVFETSLGACRQFLRSKDPNELLGPHGGDPAFIVSINEHPVFMTRAQFEGFLEELTSSFIILPMKEKKNILNISELQEFSEVVSQ